MKLWVDCHIRPRVQALVPSRAAKDKQKAVVCPLHLFPKPKRGFSLSQTQPGHTARRALLALLLWLLGKHMGQPLHLPHRVSQGTETLGN